MYFKQFQHAIRRVKARIFKLGRAEQQQNAPNELAQLAEAIVAFGGMRQQHYGSRQVLVGVEEMAMRLRETTRAIAGALDLLKHQGRAEETSMRGRWRLHLKVHRERGRDDTIREAAPTRT
jgi:hypothetical protein